MMNQSMNKRRRRRRLPVLRFSPYAWAKLLFLRDLGPTEVGGFGVAAPDDLLQIEDVSLIRQSATAWTVSFDDDAVADFFDQQVDRGLRPDRFARVWIHTHPGQSAAPSLTDEETFRRCFGRTDWAVMFILAKHGQTYARLQYNVGPRAGMTIAVTTDFFQPFAASDPSGWEAEYRECVIPTTVPSQVDQDRPNIFPAIGG